MILVKTGEWHREYGTNCQDFAVEFDNIKCIVDGCSSGDHSEVGAKLFCMLFKRYKNVDGVFYKLKELFNTHNDLLDYMLFTSFYVEENEEDFKVNFVGDGYIVLQDHNDKIIYEKIDYGPAPPYFAYNYFDKEKLTAYKEGVNFETRVYSKEDYKSVGVSSDGLQYVLASDHKKEFEEILVSRKLVRLKRFMNKYAKEFKDDFSISI